MKHRRFGLALLLTLGLLLPAALPRESTSPLKGEVGVTPKSETSASVR